MGISASGPENASDEVPAGTASAETESAAIAPARIVVCAAGVGNVRNVVRAVTAATEDRVPVTIALTRDSSAITAADILVVPGQGSFGALAEALDGDGVGLRDAIVAHVRADKPYLGICLGMQILFDESDEAPGARGLGIFAGRVRKLDPGVDDAGIALPLPHIGWNEGMRAEADGRRDAASPLPAKEHFYFAHSFVVAPTDPSLVAMTTSYGEAFPSAIAKGNVVGVQFHPEKSQRAGIALLGAFFAKHLPPRVT